MRIGVIGTGNIGSMIGAAFATKPDLEVWVYNRNKLKAEQLLVQSPTMRLADSVEELTRLADVIFLCTKVADARELMPRLGPLLRQEQVLATSISNISALDWESMTSARVAKVIPSVVQTTQSGVILVQFGSRFTAQHKADFVHLLERIAVPYQVEEAQLRVTSDLTSCGPALIAFLLSEWAKMAAATGQITFRDAQQLLVETLIGTADLLKADLSFQEIMNKVTVPGGVTEAGIRALGQHTGELFRALHQATEQHVQGASHTSVSEK